jgi:hypothetical protein
MKEKEFRVSEERSYGGDKLEGLTFRSLLLSILVLVGVVYFNNFVLYSGAIYGIEAGSEISHVAMVLPLLVMVLNPLIRRVFKKPLLTSKELIVVYIIVAVGAFVGTIGIVRPVIYGMFGLQGVNILYPRSGDIPIIDALSDLAFPKGEVAAVGFILGGMKVPWAELVLPIALWAVFAFALFMIFLSVVNLFQYRWTVTERLTYPITLPILRILEDDRNGLSSIWRDKLVYLGFIVPILFNGLSILKDYFPAMPVIPVEFDLARYAPEGFVRDALSDYPYFRFYIRPPVFALSYFAPLDFLMTFALSYLILHKGMFIILRASGYPQQVGIDFQAYHLTGAMIGLAASLVWLARTDLSVIFKAALRGQDCQFLDKTNRGMSPRFAVCMLLISCILIWSFLLFFVNVNPFIAISWLIMYIAIALAGARIRAESGVPIQSGVQLHPSITRIIIKTTGGQIFDPKAVGGMGSVFTMHQFPGCFGPLVLDTSLLFLSRFQSCLHTPDKLVSESSV